MEAVRSSETLLSTDKFTLRYHPEDQHRTPNQRVWQQNIWAARRELDSRWRFGGF
jgi:hypothetical protein